MIFDANDPRNQSQGVGFSLGLGTCVVEEHDSKTMSQIEPNMNVPAPESVAPETEVNAGLPLAPRNGTPGVVTSEEIQMIFESRGTIAEQFRALRNSITALNPDGAPRTIVIASAVEGEGKTVAAINLAIALAELPGNQVLLVDANLHDPAVESYFGDECYRGLADILSGNCMLDAAIQTTSIPNVSIMSAGELPDNPSKMMGSERTRVVLNNLKQRFSYVLIDTPAVLSCGDASQLGALADGIILVVKMGDTAKHLVEQTYNQLETLGGNVLGTCLTSGRSGTLKKSKKKKKRRK
ncbi:MAG: capsular exopolysaccharide synthesis family protein [Planctomycetota bacterium]